MAQRLILNLNQMRVTASYKSKKYKNLFGWTHYGIDITNADRNAPRIVYANGKGKVTHVGEHPTAGKFICILYKDAEFVSGAIKDVVIRYFHLEKINVKSGAYVNKDTIIAIYGNTGSSTAAHLHVEVDLDAREKYANYTPQTSKSNNYLKAGVDSTVNPRAVLWCKKSAPDNQYVIDSGYNTVDLNEINYQITE